MQGGRQAGPQSLSCHPPGRARLCARLFSLTQPFVPRASAPIPSCFFLVITPGSMCHPLY